MPKIKCAYLACKYNNAVITNDNGLFNSNVDLGECSCEDEISLVSYDCDECGCEGDGVICENFEFKEQFIK
jgi:hypothetical protein